MARVQLALNVSDLDAAVAFYAKLLGVEPAKRKPGYANFAVAEPPLKLVLIEGSEGGTLNHLGIEVEDASEVVAAEQRLSGEGLTTTGVADATCCFAQKTETWLTDPDGAPWEVYVKTGDVDVDPAAAADDGEAMCCSPSITQPVALGAAPTAGGCG